MSRRTDLARVRGLGSAKEGVAHWWAQRVTAVALVPLILWLVISLAALTGADHAAALAWIGSPATAVLLVLLLGVGMHHAQLGLQVVIEDYVHTEWLKIAALLLVKFAAAVIAVGTAFAVLKIAFAG